MNDSILEEAFGNTPNLRILSFFIENPFDKYSFKEVVKFTKIDEKSTYYWMQRFVYVGIIIQSDKHFYANRDNPIFKLINKFVGDVGMELSKAGKI